MCYCHLPASGSLLWKKKSPDRHTYRQTDISPCFPPSPSLSSFHLLSLPLPSPKNTCDHILGPAWKIQRHSSTQGPLFRHTQHHRPRKIMWVNSEDECLILTYHTSLKAVHYSACCTTALLTFLSFSLYFGLIWWEGHETPVTSKLGFYCLAI